jgi:hypothetical protein
LVPNAEEADDFIAGAQTLLASEPKSGMPCVPDESIWYLAMSPVGNRRVALFYKFDEKWVIFLLILPYAD